MPASTKLGFGTGALAEMPARAISRAAADATGSNLKSHVISKNQLRGGGCGELNSFLTRVCTDDGKAHRKRDANQKNFFPIRKTFSQSKKTFSNQKKLSFSDRRTRGKGGGREGRKAGRKEGRKEGGQEGRKEGRQEGEGGKEGRKEGGRKQSEAP